VPVKSTVAAAGPQAPDQCAGNTGFLHDIQHGVHFGVVFEAELANEIRFASLGLIPIVTSQIGIGFGSAGI